MKSTPAPSVLVVNETRSFALLLDAMLQSLGVHDITLLEDCTTARNWMRSNLVDIVLVDGDLPHEAAFGFAMGLRLDKQQARRTVPVVLMSSSGDKPVMRRAQEAGFDSVLPKPIRTAFLRDELSRLMQRPRVYIHSRAGYCGPDRRRQVMSGYDGTNRRDGDTFQVFTKDGPVSLDLLEKLDKAGGAADIEVLLVKGADIISGYRFNSRATARRKAG